jgi:hypothetical protein
LTGIEQEDAAVEEYEELKNQLDMYHSLTDHTEKHTRDKRTKQLKFAFMEYYRWLSLIHHYRTLNRAAFDDLLKRFETITRVRMADLYRKKLDGTHFGSSHVIQDLKGAVQDMYTAAFASGVRTKALDDLHVHKYKQYASIYLMMTGVALSWFKVTAVWRVHRPRLPRAHPIHPQRLQHHANPPRHGQPAPSLRSLPFTDMLPHPLHAQHVHLAQLPRQLQVHIRPGPT